MLPNNRHTVFLSSLAAAVICLLVFLRALSCGFINYDDPDYVLENMAIRALDGSFILWAFSDAYNGWWMPLTWVSLAVDHHFWGVNPFGYHLTNILLHAVNAGLVVLLADQLLRNGLVSRFKGTMAYPALVLFAGLLWGIHPLRVESVAWVSERKDVLNGLFSLGAVLCYILHAKECADGSPGGGGRRYYLLSLALFACSLMAKSVSVVLPALLLLLDWYPLNRVRQGRVKGILIEKIPFLILSLAMATATIHFASRSQYLVSYELFPFTQRLVVSGTALFEYCRLLLVPSGIIPLFMIPDPVPVSYAVKAVIVGAVCFGIYAVRQRSWIPAVWLAFVLPLLPVLAFFQNGDQAYAARFTYLPSVAPSIAAAAMLGIGYGKLAAAASRYRFFLTAIALVMLVWYAGVTVRLIAVWDNTGTFWSRVIEFEPGAQAYKERGWYRYSNGMYRQAIDDYTEAIRTVTSVWRPYLYNLYAYRGEALRAAGRYDEAVKDFTAAIERYPHPSYYYYRGAALQALGRQSEAEDDLRRGGPDPGLVEWYWEKNER